MNWQPVSNPPTVKGPASMLVATRDEEGDTFIRGFYDWTGGKFLCSETGKALSSATGEQHFWVSEDEALQGLPK